MNHSCGKTVGHYHDYNANGIKIVTIQNRYMRNRIYRMKQYNMLEQAPISAADFNALAVATAKVLNSY